MNFEIILFNFFHSLAHKSSFIDSAIVFLGEFLPYFLILIALIYFFKFRPWKRGLFAFVFSALTIILSRGIFTELIRYFYVRPRPFQVFNLEPLIIDNHPAFPSGHAAMYFALAFSIFSFNKKLGYWFLFFAFLNSLARIIAGVHWVSDIVGGASLAALSFIAIKKLVLPYRSTE